MLKGKMGKGKGRKDYGKRGRDKIRGKGTGGGEGLMVEKIRGLKVGKRGRAGLFGGEC